MKKWEIVSPDLWVPTGEGIFEVHPLDHERCPGCLWEVEPINGWSGTKSLWGSVQPDQFVDESPLLALQGMCREPKEMENSERALQGARPPWHGWANIEENHLWWGGRGWGWHPEQQWRPIGLVGSSGFCPFSSNLGCSWDLFTKHKSKDNKEELFYSRKEPNQLNSSKLRIFPKEPIKKHTHQLMLGTMLMLSSWGPSLLERFSTTHIGKYVDVMFKILLRYVHESVLSL